MITHVAPSDLDFLTIYDIDRGSDIHYDPDYAQQQINDAMTAAGAQLVNNVWQFNGQPIRSSSSRASRTSAARSATSSRPSSRTPASRSP